MAKKFHSLLSGRPAMSECLKELNNTSSLFKEYYQPIPAIRSAKYHQQYRLVRYGVEPTSDTNGHHMLRTHG